MLIIGLSGLAGAGKSEVAGQLVQKWGFKRARWAGALKEMLKALLVYRGCSPEMSERMVDGDLKEAPTPYLNGRTPRHAMQTLGKEWGRDHISENLWVDAECDRQDLRVLSHVRRNARILFDDVRFANEAEAIRRCGGSIWRIERPGLSAGGHASEQFTGPFDLVMHNDGSIDRLRVKVDDFFHRESRRRAQ